MSIKETEHYRLFKEWVPLQKISLGGLIDKTWSYYDYGPKDVIPLIFIPGTSGTAEIYFKQMVSLCPKGFRIISVQYAPYDSYVGWCKGFDRFLDRMSIEKAHVFGTALGGYLAQCYLQFRPNRVLSLILNNSFCDTQYFHDNAPCSTMFSLMPEFMLKKIVLSNFPTGLLEPDIAEGIDFMVEQLESLSQSELSSRLILNCTLHSLNPSFGLQYEKITIIDSLDSHTIPENMREEVYKYYPLAKIAWLKTGGDICYISKADELNVHIQVHLRNQGFDPVTNEAGATVQKGPSPVASTSGKSQQEALFIEEEDEGILNEDKVFSKLTFSPSAYVSSKPTATLNNNSSISNESTSPKTTENPSVNDESNIYNNIFSDSNNNSNSKSNKKNMDDIFAPTTSSSNSKPTDDIFDESLFEKASINEKKTAHSNSNPFEDDIFNYESSKTAVQPPVEVKESIFEDSFGHN